ncbi:39S ribosomal protein L36, mitochondrial [Empidonax traillii]|uniref:39S ribosomal protein L36, mitochondrial n=1 Tax=Empidonax traillii TaxID=164674 RepID=UPI000FFD050B|nr:39S ribosomal protein L36, mitochondrial [Empidonax traillii]
MLSLLARAAAAAGPLRSLCRSPLCSLAPWGRVAGGSGGAPAPYQAPRGLLAVAPPPGPPLPALVAGLKTKTVLKRRCKDCYIVRRRGRLYVYCKTNPRHKQRKG